MQQWKDIWNGFDILWRLISNAVTAWEYGNEFPRSQKNNRVFIHMLIRRLKFTGSLQHSAGSVRNRQCSDTENNSYVTILLPIHMRMP